MSILPDGSHEYDSDWFRDIYVKYGRIPLRRFGNPADMAGPAFFLCSDDAQYVTGQILMRRRRRIGNFLRIGIKLIAL